MPANQKTEDKKTEDKKTENEKNRTDTANLFKNPDGTEKILKRLRDLTDPARPLRLMEICGTHTMSIARAGLRGLLASDDFAVDGFLCPGHVAAVIGSDAFAFLPEEYGIPAVVAGFETADLLYSILELTALAAAKTPALRNTYVRLVKPQGNPAAVRLMRQVLTPAADTWRGLGVIENGGLAIRPEYAAWDAARKFSLPAFQDAEPAGCRCASVIRGALSPDACPLFGTACTPADPVGPCMVSGEGACAAAWRYGPAGLS